MTQKQIAAELADSPELRKTLANKSIEFFSTFYLSEHIKSDIPSLHKEWYEALTTYDKIAIAAPREHAKSTIFSLIYPLWCLLTGRASYIVIISDTITQAKEFVGAIAEELETNEKIKEDFGDIAGYIPQGARDKEKWTTEQINTTTGVRVQAAGIKSKLRGMKKGAQRPDLIILDDVENDENVVSSDQREKVSNVFTKSILNLGKTAKVFVIGTILHHDSLLLNLIEYPKFGWYTKIYRAIKEDGSALAPELWTLEDLEAKRLEIGSLPFAQEFENNPIDPETQIFKPVRFYSGNDLDLRMLKMFLHVDLAAEEKQSSDYNAMVSIGKHVQTNDIYVVDPRRLKTSDPYLVIKTLIELNKIYNYIKITIEQNNFQRYFQKIVKRELAADGRFPGEKLPLVGVNTVKDKVTRALTTTPYVENGRVIFNASHQDFMAELQQFPKGKHDDMVDSFIGGVGLAIDHQTTGRKVIKSGKSISYGNNY